MINIIRHVRNIDDWNLFYLFFDVTQISLEEDLIQDLILILDCLGGWYQLNSNVLPYNTQTSVEMNEVCIMHDMCIVSLVRVVHACITS